MITTSIREVKKGKIFTVSVVKKKSGRTFHTVRNMLAESVDNAEGQFLSELTQEGWRVLSMISLGANGETENNEVSL